MRRKGTAPLPFTFLLSASTSSSTTTLFSLLLLFTSNVFISTRAQTKEETGAIFHNGVILKPFLDVPRLSKKRYPYCNSTAESLNQYREEVPNGNPYNLVGENVGENTIHTHNVENISDAYARHFTSAKLSSAQGSISMGRYDSSTVRLGNTIIIAGGITVGNSGKVQKQVDIWTSVRNPIMVSAQFCFFPFLIIILP